MNYSQREKNLHNFYREWLKISDVYLQYFKEYKYNTSFLSLSESEKVDSKKKILNTEISYSVEQFSNRSKEILLFAFKINPSEAQGSLD